MQWLRPITRYLLVAALVVVATMVFSGTFPVAYPEVADAQGTGDPVNAPAVGTTGFLIMTVMLAVIMLVMFMFSRRFRENPRR